VQRIMRGGQRRLGRRERERHKNNQRQRAAHGSDGSPAKSCTSHASTAVRPASNGVPELHRPGIDETARSLESGVFR
jgi:hypothetical protein